ncbi:hypothetical protein ACQCWI_28430 [Bacillus thuringiensis]|uniref:hypothetical protein n=1 Tax=Bacillus thuringiensis TaxID=1428 RepID=UPI003CF29DA9
MNLSLLAGATTLCWLHKLCPTMYFVLGMYEEPNVSTIYQFQSFIGNLMIPHF